MQQNAQTLNWKAYFFKHCVSNSYCLGGNKKMKSGLFFLQIKKIENSTLLFLPQEVTGQAIIFIQLRTQLFLRQSLCIADALFSSFEKELSLVYVYKRSLVYMYFYTYIKSHDIFPFKYTRKNYKGTNYSMGDDSFLKVSLTQLTVIQIHMVAESFPTKDPNVFGFFYCTIRELGQRGRTTFF